MRKIALFFFLVLISRQSVVCRDSAYMKVGCRSGKIYMKNSNGTKWLHKGFPSKIVLGKRVPRRIMALSVSPAGKRILVATKFSIYTFSPKKDRWVPFARRGINRYASISALCDTGRAIYLGTTCYGIYKFNGRRWVSLRRGLPGEEPPRHRKFYETVTALSVARNGTVFAGFHFGRGVYALRSGKNIWYNVKLSRPVFRVSAIYPFSDSGMVYDGRRWVTFANSSRNGGFSGVKSAISDALHAGVASSFAGAGYAIGCTGVEKMVYHKVRPIVRNKRGLYINSYRAKPWRLRRLIPLMKRKGLNTLVVDVKDDYGRVLYKGKLAVVKKTGAYRSLLQVKKLVALCKKNRIHLVARLVTFKDPRLHRYLRGRYAVRDRYTRGLWNPKSQEKWVDPFNAFVRNYNIAIAKEILSLGFDEIQFDYIRFPTDGPTYRAYYPARWRGAWKVDALENFLAKARSVLYKPFSVDIYGFNSWYSLGRWMGQDVTLFSAYADAISPMHYPSHFDRTFRIERGRGKRTFDILYHGTLRPIALASRKVEIRPYLQAFRWRAYRYGKGYWEQQVKGVYKGGSRGFIFWDATSRYRLLPWVRLVKKSR